MTDVTFDPAPAASILADAWRSGEQLTELPAEIRPQTLAQGYDIQDRLIGAPGPAGRWMEARRRQRGPEAPDGDRALDRRPRPPHAPLPRRRHRAAAEHCAGHDRIRGRLRPRPRHPARRNGPGALRHHRRGADRVRAGAVALRRSAHGGLAQLRRGQRRLPRAGPRRGDRSRPRRGTGADAGGERRRQGSRAQPRRRRRD